MGPPVTLSADLRLGWRSATDQILLFNVMELNGIEDGGGLLLVGWFYSKIQTGSCMTEAVVLLDTHGKRRFTAPLGCVTVTTTRSH